RDAKIMPLRITNDSAGWAYWSDIANGVTWATDHGAKVVSNSFASYQGSTVIAASDVLRSKGGLMIASGGNDSAALTYADNSIIVAGATDSADNKASWSNTGPFVDVAAPGLNVYTTGPSGATWSVSGTSFSAPLTAGLVALIMGVNPLLTPNDVENILETTTVDLGAAGKDDLFGNGRINAAAAIAKAKTFVPTTVDTILPIVSVSNPVAGSKVAGLVPVDILATDNVGVTRVDLMVNGAFYASDTTSPYNFVWDTTSLKNVPSMTLSAVAVDAAGNKSTSTGVSVQVENIVDTMPPVVSITNPANNSKVSGSISIKASITDNVGVLSSSLLIDGSVVSTGTGSISYSWNTRKAKAGTHTISVVGKDTSNNTTTSQITVTK
ncbi:MAG: Ig-like domain-containing protein, partial [Pseudomonadota bacterium]